MPAPAPNDFDRENGRSFGAFCFAAEVIAGWHERHDLRREVMALFLFADGLQEQALAASAGCDTPAR